MISFLIVLLVISHIRAEYLQFKLNNKRAELRLFKESNLNRIMTGYFKEEKSKVKGEI